MWCLTLFRMFLTVAWAAGIPVRAPQSAQTSCTSSESAAYHNTVPGVKYLGSKVCAECHKDIYENFSKTGMGRSMSTIRPSVLGKVPATGTVFAKDLNRSFQVYRQGSDLYQSEYEVDAKGKEIYETEIGPIRYSAGTGSGFRHLQPNRGGTVTRSGV